MDNERWQVVESLFHSALRREPRRRNAFLAKKCAEDALLRAQVEALLRSHDRAGDFIEHSPVETAARALSASECAPFVNQQIGRYRALSLLGKGGMGDVYLAEDLRLGRRVALKILPAPFAQSTQQLQRFEQEAHAATALNHPNILTVHDTGHVGNTHFIATEYVEGETLRQRLATGRLQFAEALDIGIQIAEALSVAHDAGIIHRDIKPENIMIRRDGYVKILDFGLAKLTQSQDAVRDGGNLNFRRKPSMVMVMGTINYMSPEQALGREVDHRTDLFNLGVVLFEIFTGTPFLRESTEAVAIDDLRKLAPSQLADCEPDLLIELERILKKALETDREMRYQTASDLRSDLEYLKRTVDSDTKTNVALQIFFRNITGRRSARFSLAAFLLVILAGSSYLLFHSEPGSDLKPPDWSNATFTPITDQSGEEIFPSLSPDGSSLVYASRSAGNWDIYLKRVGEHTSINLTEDSTADDNHPIFSPDGQSIAFRSEREGGGIFIMGVTGENIRRLTDFGYNPAWSPGGKEIVCAEARTADPANRSVIPSKLWTINVTTGEKMLITEGDAVQPNWSPRGHRIAYWGLKKGGQRDLWTIPAAGGAPLQITDDDALDWNPVWAPDGKYLYFASDRSGSMNLWRVAIEEETGRVLGEPETVRVPSFYSQHISFSRDGRSVAYGNVFSKLNIRQAVFDPVKETVSKQVWITEGSRQMSDPDLSPDGQWLVFSSQGEKQEDIIIVRADGRGPPRKLTDDIHRDRGPQFSPDGEKVAFYSDRGGKFEIWTINTDGRDLHQITQSTRTVFNPVWSQDGTQLAYSILGVSAAILNVSQPLGQRVPQVLPLVSSPELRFAAWSWTSDGKKIAGGQSRIGQSNLGIVVYSIESQQYEQLTDFGKRPRWLRDNRRLLFYSEDKLYLLDSESRTLREILSTSPNEITGLANVRDDWNVYFTLKIAEADIWMMSLE